MAAHPMFYALVFVALFTDGVNANMDAIFSANGAASKIAGGPKFTGVGEGPPEDGDTTFGSTSEVKLFEGDIVFTNEIRTFMSEGTTYDSRRNMQWRGRLVPYTFERGYTYLAGPVAKAVQRFNQQLSNCIKFVKYSSRQAIRAKGIRAYIVFFAGGGCYSQVGMLGYEQKISLGRGCTRRGTVMHEIMHALGFWHEQSRDDRDEHITINWNNINPRMRYNFQMKRRSDTLGEPYDINSIMHYGPTAFSTNRQPTIVHKGGVTRFGWKSELSPIDIRQLRKYYKCGGTGTGTKPKPKPKPASCTPDTGSHCEGWKKVGYCTHSRWGSYMKSHCATSCGCCDSKPNCAKWKESGFCTGRYATYMGIHCKQTCNKC